jgi:ParB family chromosome partitioning protein
MAASSTPLVVEQDAVVVRIPLGMIETTPWQPRTFFDEVRLAELRSSIHAKGQRRPGIVGRLPGDHPDKYRLVDGERRFRTLAALEMPYFKAEIREYKNKDEMFQDMVIANFGGEGHTDMEIAFACERFMQMEELQGMSMTARQQHIADICSKSISWVQQHLLLLKLHPDVQKLIEPSNDKRRPRLQLTVAVELATNIVDMKLQVELANHIVDNKMKSWKAIALIRGKTDRKPETRRGRKPSDGVRMFLGLVRGIGSNADKLLSIGRQEFTSTVHKLASTDKRKMVEHIDEGIEQLQQLREIVTTGGSQANGHAAEASN